MYRPHAKYINMGLKQDVGQGRGFDMRRIGA